jgi:hypothetical protein
MVIAPHSESVTDTATAPCALERETLNWVGFAAGGTLLAAGLMLLAGQRRAGMVAAASGTALALLDQQETLRSWWNTLPGYIDDIEQLLTQVQGVVEDMAVQRERLRRVLSH